MELTATPPGRGGGARGRGGPWPAGAGGAAARAGAAGGGGGGGRGRPHAAPAGQHEPDGGLQTDAVADGDEDRLHAGAGAQHGADDFVVVDERRPGADLVGGLVVAADEP